MISSSRCQIGKLLIDNPMCVIHTSWNKDKTEDAQRLEVIASKQLVEYAKLKHKWFIFISTLVERDNAYVKAKREVENYIKEQISEYTILRLPTIVSKGTLFEYFYTGKYENPFGDNVRFITIPEAVKFINQYIMSPKVGIFYPDIIYELPDYVVKEIARFYAGITE